MSDVAQATVTEEEFEAQIPVPVGYSVDRHATRRRDV